MKKVILSLSVLVGILFIYAQVMAVNTDVEHPLAAAFSWDKTKMDFGKISQGVPKTATFNFTNTGDVPLVITNAKGSCGCTVTDFSKDPIMPGQSGNITATYNAASVGQFTKTVTVSANTAEKTHVLTITGEVVTQ